MRKILFLNPPVSMEQRYGKLALAGAMEPPHGLTYLAAVARRAGWAAEILDAEALHLPPGAVIDAVRASAPDILACTAVTLTVERAAEVAGAVKEALPRAVTLLGGVHLTSLPDETMRRYRCFDYGVAGEGEQTLREFLETAAGGGGAGDIPGMVVRRGESVHRAPPRPYLKDLDMLPCPAWDLLPTLRRHYFLPPQSVRRTPSTSIITSRGCTGRCTFCDNSVFRNICRAHSAEYVMEMLGRLSRDFGIREVLFEDDNFMIFRPRLRALAELLPRAPFRMSWSCLARVDMMPDDETLRALRKAGCWQILFGIESGCQEILDAERKGITLDQIARAVRTAHETGFRTKGFLMVGHPGETPETLARTAEFVRRLPLDDISVTYFTVFPGSPIWPEAPRYGSVTRDYGRMSVFHPTFIARGFTAQSLERHAGLMLKKFYLRPGIILSYLGRLRSPAQFWSMAKGAWALLAPSRRREPPGEGAVHSK